MPNGSDVAKSGQMSLDDVHQALARIADEHPEHREVLDRAGALLNRMWAALALIKGALRSGRGVDDIIS